MPENESLETFIKQHERKSGRPLTSYSRFLLRAFISYSSEENPVSNEAVSPRRIPVLQIRTPAPKAEEAQITTPANTKTTVAFITENVGHTTGGRYYAWFVATALQELGFDVTIYTNLRPGFYDNFKQYKQPRIAIASNSTQDLENLDVKADIYIGAPISGNIGAIRLGQKYHKPSYPMIFDPFPMMEKLMGKKFYTGWDELIRLLRTTDTNVLSLCNTTSEYIYDWLNKRPDQVQAVYPCINDVELDLSTEVNREDYVVFISRLVSYKNIDHCLEACKANKIRLKIVSSTEDENTIRMVKNMGMTKQVDFHFKISDREKWEIIRKSRGVINGSIFEGWGIYVAEAIACGIPFIGYDLPTFQEIREFSQVHNMYLAKFKDIKDLTHKLKTALKEARFEAPKDMFNFEHMKTRCQTVFAQEPRIGVVQIALNEAQFVGASLHSVIRHPNITKVAVVEGACNLFAAAADANGLSTDTTRQEILKVMQSPQGNKISYQQYGFATDKTELRNKALELLGRNIDYVLILDADEVWSQDDLDRLVKAVKENPRIGVFSFKHLHFWKNLKTLATGSNWEFRLFRFFKYEDKSLRWVRHEMPVMSSEGKYIHQSDGSMTLDDVSVYHLGYMKQEKNVQDKIAYYQRRDGQFLHVKDTFTNWKPGQPTSTTHGQGGTQPYHGDYPEEIKQLMAGGAL